MKIFFYFGLLFLFFGCDNTQTKEKHNVLDGKVLLKTKCSQCHNVDFPPKDFDNEIAPAMMSISIHFNDWFKATSSNEKLQKQINFVSDYVINPSKSKAYCDKKMLNKYGLMPSQKGKITKDELAAISEYVFTNFTQEKLMQKQQALKKLHSLPLGEQLVIKYRCLSCHKKEKKLVGPSFRDIGKKYKNNMPHIINSIKNGSKNLWEQSHGAIMPKFNNISSKDLKIISKWIEKYSYIK